MSSLSFRLAQQLTVSSVSSPQFGYLLSLRVIGQNSVLVSLPRLVERDTELVFDFTYSGRLDPQGLDREAIAPQGQIQQPPAPQAETILLLPEPRYLYSNRVYWHPQAPVSDYATATIAPHRPVGVSGRGQRPPDRFDPVADRRRERDACSATIGAYRRVPTSIDRCVTSACVISRFVPIGTARLAVAAVAPAHADRGTHATAGGDGVSLEVVSTPRMIGRNRQTMSRLSSIMSFFATTMGEAPYPNFTLATLDDNLPGGHSPAYLRGLSSAAADDAVLLGRRPGVVRQHLSAVLPRARSGPSVVGPGGRLEELPRAVDQ